MCFCGWITVLTGDTFPLFGTFGVEKLTDMKGWRWNVKLHSVYITSSGLLFAHAVEMENFPDIDCKVNKPKLSLNTKDVLIVQLQDLKKRFMLFFPPFAVDTYIKSTPDWDSVILTQVDFSF